LLQGAGADGSAPGVDGSCTAVVLGTFFGSSTAVLTVGTWHHIALVRESGTCTLYVDGTSVASTTESGSIDGQNLAIGGYYDTNFLYDGYLDDLRITKGVARYTANFTPPEAKLLNL